MGYMGYMGYKVILIVNWKPVIHYYSFSVPLKVTKTGLTHKNQDT